LNNHFNLSYQRSYEVPEGKKGKDPVYYEMGSSVLKNKLGITDPLKAVEEETIGFIQSQMILTEKLTKRTRFNEDYIKTYIGPPLVTSTHSQEFTEL